MASRAWGADRGGTHEVGGLPAAALTNLRQYRPRGTALSVFLRAGLASVDTYSIAVQKQCTALSFVLLKPKDAAVQGEHVDAA